MADIALVARLQRGERLVGGERGRGAFGGARLAATRRRTRARRYPPRRTSADPSARSPRLSQLSHMTFLLPDCAGQDAATIDAELALAEVIHQNQDNIGLALLRRRWRAGSARGETEEGALGPPPHRHFR